MSDLTADIREAIEKNLPKQVGDALQKQLHKLENMESANASLIKERDGALDSFASLQATIDDYQRQIQRHTEIGIRERDVQAREIRQELNDVRLEEAGRRADLAKEFLTLVFRSPVTRQSITRSVPVAVDGTPAFGEYSSASGGYVEQHNETETVETSQE